MLNSFTRGGKNPYESLRIGKYREKTKFRYIHIMDNKIFNSFNGDKILYCKDIICFSDLKDFDSNQDLILKSFKDIKKLKDIIVI